jgi:hypothetical protein
MKQVLVNGTPVEYEHAPRNCRDTLERYIEHGIPMGSFLTAFCANDLMGALGRADDINICQFKEIGMFLYNYAPGNCFGSYEKVLDYSAERLALREDA